MNEITPKKRFTPLSRLKVRVLSLYKKLDVKKVHLESLDLNQQKVIEIARICIQNKNSHLYAHPKTGFAQIELPEIFITIEQAHGFYEVDLVYIKQILPTSDKIIFDSSGILHIYNEFDKEIGERMKSNTQRRNKAVTDHLDNLLKATEDLS